MIHLEAWHRELTGANSYYRIPEDQARIVTIEDVAKRWSEEGDKLYDVDWINGKYHVIVPTEVLVKYREFDRAGENAAPNSRERIEELKQSLQEQGWVNPLHITVYRDGQPPKLSEGNHRLVAAQELGIREIPVVFFFYRGNAGWI